jgi:hypothetical protein
MIVVYSRIMAITHSDELCYSPSARDTKSSSRVIVINIRSLNNIPTINLQLIHRAKVNYHNNLLVVILIFVIDFYNGKLSEKIIINLIQIS